MTPVARATVSRPAPHRGTLGRPTLAALAAAAVVLAVPLVLAGRPYAPDHVVPQILAVIGAALLLVPVLFSIAKRREARVNAPAWFRAHGVASVLGLAFVCGHVAGGEPWASPVGALLLLAVALVAQGIAMRVTLPQALAERFAARPASFVGTAPTDRDALRSLIEAKRALLARLEASASEATFSPRLVHWLRSPALTARYAALARREALLVGRRDAAARRLALWRRVHIAGAALFVVGVMVHVAVSLAGSA